MNILGWRVSFRRKRCGEPSKFAGVLPRLRAMRENCDWPVATTPATRDQRRVRVEQARRRIVYRPEPFETMAEPAPGPATSHWLKYLVPFGLLAAAVVWVIVVYGGNDPRVVAHGFNYQLPSAPPFLSERMARIMAMKALAEFLPDPMAWEPEPHQVRKARPAPDGTRDLYMIRGTPTSGSFFFISAQHPNEGGWNVVVQLQGAQVWCWVSKPIQAR